MDEQTPEQVTTFEMVVEALGIPPQGPEEDHFDFLDRVQPEFNRAVDEGRLEHLGLHPPSPTD